MNRHTSCKTNAKISNVGSSDVWSSRRWCKNLASYCMIFPGLTNWDFRLTFYQSVCSPISRWIAPQSICSDSCYSLRLWHDQIIVNWQIWMTKTLMQKGSWVKFPQILVILNRQEWFIYITGGQFGRQTGMSLCFDERHRKFHVCQKTPATGYSFLF